MNDLGELTDAEVALIRDRRAELARIAAEREFRPASLATAARYGRWLDEHGRGSSFSTFVNEFGYEAPDCKAMYAAVTLLLNAAEEIG